MLDTAIFCAFTVQHPGGLQRRIPVYGGHIPLGACFLALSLCLSCFLNVLHLLPLQKAAHKCNVGLLGKQGACTEAFCCCTAVLARPQDVPEWPASQDCRPGLLFVLLLESHLLAEDPQRCSPSPSESCLQAPLHSVLVLHLPTTRHCPHLNMQHISMLAPDIHMH